MEKVILTRDKFHELASKVIGDACMELSRASKSTQMGLTVTAIGLPLMGDLEGLIFGEAKEGEK